MGLGRTLAVSGGAVVGGVGAVKAVPSVLGAVGFTSAGVAAGSFASSMMSAAAKANGGGVAAGSLVAFLQSAGAAGLSANNNTAVARVGASIGAGFVESFFQDEEENNRKMKKMFFLVASSLVPITGTLFVFFNGHGLLWAVIAAAASVAGVGWLAKVCWEERENKRQEEEMEGYIWMIATLALGSYVYLNSRADRRYKNTK